MAKVMNKASKVVIPSANTPDYAAADWIYNPDLTAVAGVPAKYWKCIADPAYVPEGQEGHNPLAPDTLVQEMSQAEKDAVDAAEAATEGANELAVSQTLWFDAPNPNKNVGKKRARRIGKSANFRFTFKLPTEATKIVKVTLWGIPSNSAAGPGRCVCYEMDGGMPGEPHNAVTGCLVRIYDLTGLGDQPVPFDITQLMTDNPPVVDSVCGIRVRHKSIGGHIDYVGVQVQVL